VQPLDEPAVRRGAAVLAASDPDLARVLGCHGPPPLWSREAGFATLVHLILEQQVSLASAAAAMARLVSVIGLPDPGRLLSLDDAALHAIGFSRQKRAYARDLAHRILDGRLRLDDLEAAPDSEVIDRLTRVKGIGRWTADIYLLMALGRPDVWPVGDRALVVAVRRLRGLDRDPDPEEMAVLGERWRPKRSIAARMLWHLYLSEIRPRGGRASAPLPAT
jgi:DNA-3-methyladenine glycosylase II